VGAVVLEGLVPTRLTLCMLSPVGWLPTRLGGYRGTYLPVRTVVSASSCAWQLLLVISLGEGSDERNEMKKKLSAKLIT